MVPASSMCQVLMWGSVYEGAELGFKRYSVSRSFVASGLGQEYEDKRYSCGKLESLLGTRISRLG